jgi:hypothetical protein
VTLALALLGTTASAAQALPRSNAEFSCTAITVRYTGFPDEAGNTIRENVRIDRVRRAVTRVFTFDGPEGVDTIPLNLGLGHHSLDVFATWRTNGVRGGHDQQLQRGIRCGAGSSMTVEKLQKLESQEEYVTAAINPGRVGEAVDYEIVVRNTGNTPLLLENFTDPGCEEGTISGGPGETPLAPAGPSSPAGETAYFCTHTLTEADREAGEYTNVAIATVAPQGCEECAPITRESNTVVVLVPTPPAPAFTIEKLQRISGSFTAEALSGEVGQRVEYEIVVMNTGNTPLEFASLTDERCDAGTIAGGPGVKTLAPGVSTTFTCSHALTRADQTAGRYENTAAETGKMPNGAPIAHTSNTVLITVPAPTAAGPTPGTPSGGTLSSSGGGTGAGEGGVLAFHVSTPALAGPRACVRRAFAVSIKAQGVLSVTFYLDGRKLKKLAMTDARGGALTAYVRVARLRVGKHHLVAKIAMRANTASTKPSHVTRSLTVARCAAAAAAKEPRFTG